MDTKHYTVFAASFTNRVNTMKEIYTASEIFTDIPGDPGNVTMTIPPEILKEMGWTPEDILTITIEDDGTVAISKE